MDRDQSDESSLSVSTPSFWSWDEFVEHTGASAIRKMCHARTKKANAKRLMSDAPDRKLSAVDVWEIMSSARGRCVHCDSLAVETTPYAGSVKLPWEHMGRRIGTVEHLRSRVGGGGNESENLAWACLWCNDYPSERRRGALDHGGHFPPDDGDRSPVPPPWPFRQPVDYGDAEEADAYGFVEEDDPFGYEWT